MLDRLERLIDGVKNHPVLYGIKGRKRLRHQKVGLWEEVGKLCGLSGKYFIQQTIHFKFELSCQHLKVTTLEYHSKLHVSVTTRSEKRETQQIGNILIV